MIFSNLMDRAIPFRLLIGREKYVKFCRIFRDKFPEKSANFLGIFGANFALKTIGKKRPILWLFSGKIR